MFSNEFDRTLGLMLISDKNNRNDILNFVRSIPDELYEQICIQLDKFKNYEESNVGFFDREDVCLCGSSYGRFNLKYLFIVDMIQNSLTISTGFERNDSFIKSFEMTLYAKSRYNSIELFDNQLLGVVINYTDDTKTEYKLIDTVIGKMVVCSNNNIFKKYKLISKNIENIELNTLINKKDLCMVKKLVR